MTVHNIDILDLSHELVAKEANANDELIIQKGSLKGIHDLFTGGEHLLASKPPGTLLFHQVSPDPVMPAISVYAIAAARGPRWCRQAPHNAVPRRAFFALLKHFTQDDVEREKLKEFLTEEGADDLYEYCQKPHRRIHEVLSEFRSVHIPRAYIFDLFPPLRPRQFSIASSSHAHPRRIHLCVAIVNYRTMLKVPRRGVCTTWLLVLKPGDTLQIGLQKGFIALPTNPATPLICIGPGTGVAPMCAVIQERLHVDTGAAQVD